MSSRQQILGSVIVAMTMAFGCSQEVDSGDVEGSTSALLEGFTPRPLIPLDREPLPVLTNNDIVDQRAAARLGKAFFWDVQIGSDAQTACATCHFKAGIDTRALNTVAPGADGVFQLVAGAGEYWNGQTDPVGIDDVIGSQGVLKGGFLGVDRAGHADVCEPIGDRVFSGNRQVTGRNTPTIINAVFNYDNFWDGRARFEFNGADPFGTGGAGTLRMENGSLASQAVGPPTNDIEMSCIGRSFEDIAEKILDRTPLALQRVDPSDSLLGPIANTRGNGTNCANDRPCTYRELIEDAFGAELARTADTQLARIWGQAVQAYATTLVSDRAPIDEFLRGNRTALTQRQQLGLRVFRGEFHPGTVNLCMNCHHGALFTDASIGFVRDNPTSVFDDTDQGFHNLGIDPTSADLGRMPFARNGHARNAGAFKTPSLRNISLTGPYFHDGSATTIADAVNLYDRGGNFQNAEKSRVIPGPANRPGQLFTDWQRDALVDFLTNALTDCRVARDAAPFDHPSLDVPNGPSLPAVGAAGDGARPCGP